VPKRGGRRLLMPCGGSRHSITTTPKAGAGDWGLEQVVGDSPTPEFAVIMADECGRLLGQLDDDLRKIAVAKMEGFTNK
jgi:hypothetical protein